MHYDLAIVGGGLVGAGLAAALHDSGLNIALMDAAPPRSADPRLLALNYSSCQFLRNLNLWPDLAPHANPIHQVHVSQAGQFGSLRLSREDVQLLELGHVIPAYHIEQALNKRLASLNRLTFYRPAQLTQLVQSPDHVALTFTEQEKKSVLTASLVVGADGAASTVREALGIPAKHFDYHQSAIVTKTTLHRAHQHIAYERFCANGAIAMLPLADRESATIWTADNEYINNLMALSEEAFLTTLQSKFGYRLGRFEKINARHVFPLKMVIAEKSIDQSVILLGNAAHSLHPIAAQGFNLALYGAAVLAEYIIRKMAAGESMHANDLQRVHELIQDQQKTSIQLSHRLAQIFSHSLVKNLLPIGMVGLDLFPGLKYKLINKLMGRSGKTPALLLG